MQMRKSLITAILLMGASLPAQAQDDWKSWPTGEAWRITAAYFQPKLDTTIVVTDAEGNIGTGISFEKNLGLDETKGTGTVFVDWRFFKRHKLTYNYFQLNRSGTSTEGSVTIGIGDAIFDVELPIQAFFDITANVFSYSYSLLFDEKKDLSVGIGLSVQDLAFGIQGTASSPNPGELLNSELYPTAPLPTLNAGFNYAFNDKWLFESKIGWLEVEADLSNDDLLDGAIKSATVGVRWKAFDNVSFLARYQLLDVDVDFSDQGALYYIDYDYNGPLLGVAVNF